MNVIFHTTAAIGVAVLITDSNRNLSGPTILNKVGFGAVAFGMGIISHAALDYIPHCYPINSKIDAILGLSIIIIITWLAKTKYRLVVALSFLGSVFPDLVDLSPAIINKLLGFDLPIFKRFFPWHLHEYSGSIYNNDCKNSTLNHILLLLTLGVFIWFRRRDFKAIFYTN